MKKEITVWVCGLCAYRGIKTEMFDKHQICAHVCEYLQPYIHPSQAKEHAETIKRFYKKLTIVYESATWECGLCVDSGIQKPIISMDELEVHICNHLEEYILPGKKEEYIEEFQRFYDVISQKTIAL